MEQTLLTLRIQLPSHYPHLYSILSPPPTLKLKPNRTSFSCGARSRSKSSVGTLQKRLRLIKERAVEGANLRLENNINKKENNKNPSDIESESESESEKEEEDDEDDEDAEESILSLTEKPERNMELLEDYFDDDDGGDYGKDVFSYDPNTHRSGFVAVLGRPNVGKSTLMNQMIGQKLCIVTNKPQTTRHRILGLCSEDDYQIVLYDTPGVIKNKMHKLDNMMMRNVRTAAVDADCVIVVVDACKMPSVIDEVIEEGLGTLNKKLPILLVLNKKDLIKPGEIGKKIEWYQKFTEVDDVIPVSAKYGHGVNDVRDWIVSKLPLGPPYYPKDIASEHPERFFIGEIVREKIFLQYKNEVPYACQVNVVSYKTRPNAKDFIQVEIIAEKESQKMILIGKEGKALKLLASAARADIEDFLQKEVYLEVQVKVNENWRQDEILLKRYGYGGEIRVL